MTCAFSSALGIMLCNHHLKILNYFRTRGPTFLFCTGFQFCQDIFSFHYPSHQFYKSGGSYTNKTFHLIKELWRINYSTLGGINMQTIIYECFHIYTYKYSQFRAKFPSPDNPFSDFLWFLVPPQCCKWEPSQEVVRTWYEV